MFSQDPRESRSKARTGTGAHNPSRQPTLRTVPSALVADFWFCFQPQRKLGSQYFLGPWPCTSQCRITSGESVSIFHLSGALGPRDVDVLRERLSLEVDLST